MDADVIVEVVLQMKVPFKYRMSKSEALKWRLQQAVELTRKETVNNIFEASMKNAQKYKY